MPCTLWVCIGARIRMVIINVTDVCNNMKIPKYWVAHTNGTCLEFRRLKHYKNPKIKYLDYESKLMRSSNEPTHTHTHQILTYHNFISKLFLVATFRENCIDILSYFRVFDDTTVSKLTSHIRFNSSIRALEICCQFIKLNEMGKYWWCSE